jgi:predicted LPLAT superfamily acyltransferase
MVWLALHAGREVARALLYPISAFFLLLARPPRQASFDYLARLKKQPAGWRDTFRHYHAFAETILDRVFVFAGRADFLTLDVQGFDLLEAQLGKGEGCLLLGAHMGSFEILRGLGVQRQHLPIKALVYQNNSAAVRTLFERLNPDLAAQVINIGSADSLVGVDQHVGQGGMLAILGDRDVHGGKRVLCDFLGEPAWFPAAPTLLAHLLKVPVILFYCLRLGPGRYAIRFERFAERIELPRQNRDAAIAEWVQRYAVKLEQHCRLAPYNWFNFYDFWDGGR